MRVLVVGAIAPEGLAYLRERNIQVTELAKAHARDAVRAHRRLRRADHPLRDRGHRRASGNVVSAAEHTIGMLLALVRRYSRRARAAEGARVGSILLRRAPPPRGAMDGK